MYRHGFVNFGPFTLIERIRCKYKNFFLFVFGRLKTLAKFNMVKSWGKNLRLLSRNPRIKMTSLLVFLE